MIGLAMNRAKAIEHILSQLEAVDDETLDAVAELLSERSTARTLPRPLTTREFELIEQSKTDFREGRTMTLSESRKHVHDKVRRRLGLPSTS